MQEIILPVETGDAKASMRTLGLMGIVLAPALFISFLFHSGNSDVPNPNQLYQSIFGALYMMGAAASITAMRRMRVTGRGTGAAILYVVQIVGLFLAMCFDVLEYAAPQLRGTALFTITDIAYPLSHLLMIFMGIAVWRAGVWRGWRLIPSFLVGFALPAAFASSILLGWENSTWVFLAGITFGFALLGLAVLTWRENAQAA
jgi:hypothetical protein